MPPIIVQEDLWKPFAGLGMYVVTTCNVEKSIAGVRRLVMGKGAALEMLQRFPSIDVECSFWIHEVGNPSPYGFRVVRSAYEYQPGIGIFQVKHHYKDDARLSLIDLSAKELCKFAHYAPEVSIRLNYPGIGAGGLTREQVEPLLMNLPGNVTICYR